MSEFTEDCTENTKSYSKLCLGSYEVVSLSRFWHSIDSTVRKCLDCNKYFPSEGEYNRKCDACNKREIDTRYRSAFENEPTPYRKFMDNFSLWQANRNIEIMRIEQSRKKK